MKYLFSFLFLFSSITTYCQPEGVQRCAHDEWLEEIEQEQPGYIQKIQNSFKQFKAEKKSSTRSVNIVIPVHVIVVHPTGQPIGTGSNHSLEHVQSQIDVLNEDFGRYNSDAGNTPPEFPAVDTQIQFCLATVDPDGNPTDGITRYAFDGAFDPNASAIREATRWPRESYSNIWSAPNLPYLGLASVPSTFALPSPNNDFIHVDAASFGGPGFASFPNYDLGRTTTHEMGHWLGLFHVWASNGCGNDDGMDDTPLQDDENFGCPNHPSPSCGNNGDMFMNYMDYVNDNCMNAFTQDQADYMNLILTTSRASLNGSSFTACATFVPLTLSVISQSDPNCSDSNDGVILVEAAGGVPGYSYSINGSAPNTDNLFTDLPGGAYFIEVFDSDGNTASVNVNLNFPLPVTATINLLQDNVCPGDSNGIFEIQVSGGSNPYQYTLNMSPPQTSNTFSDLPNGFYVYTVEDNNGCTYEDVYDFSNSDAISITIDSTNDLTCSNDNTGFILASAEGGNGPLSYSINGFDFQDDGEFMSLDGGDYFVYVQDTTGCFDSLAVNLGEPDPFFISLESVDVSCYGLSDGSVNVTAMGGNGGPYQYSFDSLDFGDETMLENLSAGEYELFALDSLGCLAIASFEIEEPDSLVASIDMIIDVSCYGMNSGLVSINATGGNGQNTFILNGDSTMTGVFDNLIGGEYGVLVVDAEGCEASISFEIDSPPPFILEIVNTEMPSCFGDNDGSIEVSVADYPGELAYAIDNGANQDSPIFSGLSSASYLITVFDEIGCNASITVTLDQPDPLDIVNLVANDASCFGFTDGSIDVDAMGGTPPYTFEILPEGSGMDELAAGSYVVYVEDANGCISEEAFTINEPDELLLTIIEQGEADCETGLGATLSIDAAGGAGGFSYVLEGPSGTLESDDGKYTLLKYGGHEAVVTDANGCEASTPVNITFENGFFAEIATLNDVSCFGEGDGSVDLAVQGGLGTITYILNGVEVVEPKGSNLPKGDYVFIVQDENDCEIEIEFTIQEPDELVVDEMVIDEVEGTITVNVSGGTAPYLYSFDNGESFMESNVLEDFEAGEITVIVQDANGCEAMRSLIIDSTVDITQQWGITIYPNPFLEEFTLDLDFQENTDASIQIFDIQGRLTHNIPTKKYNSGHNFVKINVRNFASSIYIVKIASADGYRYIKATKL